jgi:N-acetylmuramoyl-L-alanine amidase
MRFINCIIWHCFDTRTDQNFGIKDVTKWHLARGFSGCGYHYIIRLDGTIESGRALARVGAHCKGHNRGSIGVSFEGGKTPDGFRWVKPTNEQLKSAKELKMSLESKLGKGLDDYGHYQFSESKSCPNFDICILTDYYESDN